MASNGLVHDTFKNRYKQTLADIMSPIKEKIPFVGEECFSHLIPFLLSSGGGVEKFHIAQMSSPDLAYDVEGHSFHCHPHPAPVL